MLNVCDFAYRNPHGTDMTSANDWTPAFRAARDALGMVGADRAGKVYIPAGLYTIDPQDLEDNAALLLTRKPYGQGGDIEVLWDGDGAGGTILHCPRTDIDIIAIAGTTDFVRRCSFQNLMLNGGRYGIRAQDWGYGHVMNVTFANQNEYAIYGGGGIQNIDFNHLILHHTTGIYLQDVTVSTVRGCSFGEDIQATNGLTIRGGLSVIIANNFFSSLRGRIGPDRANAGIEILGGTLAPGMDYKPASHIQVVDNNFDAINEYAVLLRGDVRFVRVVGNMFASMNLERPGEPPVRDYSDHRDTNDISGNMDTGNTGGLYYP